MTAYQISDADLDALGEKVSNDEALHRKRDQVAAVAPVAVSERPWELEGWCDAEGRCWVGRLGFREKVEETGKFFTMPHEWQLEEPELDPVFPCVLLPHWAIPLPTTPQEPQP